jgi:hypothetical protein
MTRLVVSLLALACALTLVIRDRRAALSPLNRERDWLLPESREQWSLRLTLAAYVARSVSLVVALCVAFVGGALRLLSLVGVSS